jgi:nucleoid-associated protein YgaU
MTRARAAALGTLALASVAAAPSPSPDALHEVQDGETLVTIAAETLGDPALWPALYRANRDQIRDPARLYPGQKLAIPTLTAEQRETARRDAEVHKLQ